MRVSLFLAVLLVLAPVLAVENLYRFEPEKIGEVVASEENALVFFLDNENYVLMEDLNEDHWKLYYVIGGETYPVLAEKCDCGRIPKAGIIEAGNPHSAFLFYPTTSVAGKFRAVLDNGEWAHTIDYLAYLFYPPDYLTTYENWYYFRARDMLITVPRYPIGEITTVSGNFGMCSTPLLEENVFFTITYDSVRKYSFQHYPLEWEQIGYGEFPKGWTHYCYIIPQSSYVCGSDEDVTDDWVSCIDHGLSNPLSLEIEPPAGWTRKSRVYYDPEENVAWRILNNGFENVLFLLDLETNDAYEVKFSPMEYSKVSFFPYAGHDATVFFAYNTAEGKYEVFQLGDYRENIVEEPSQPENNNPYSVINQDSWTREPIIEEVFEIQHDEGYSLVYYHDPDNYGLISGSLECPSYECFYPLKVVINGELKQFAVEEQPYFVTLLEPNNEESIIAVTPSKIYYGRCLYCGYNGWRNKVTEFNLIVDAIPLRYINNYGITGEGEVSEWVIIGRKDGETEFKLYRVRVFHETGHQISAYASADENMIFAGIDWYNGYFVVKNMDTNKCIAYGFNPHGWNESIEYLGMEDCGGSFGASYRLGSPFTFAGKGYEYSVDGKARVYWMEEFHNLELAEFEIPKESEDWYSVTSTLYDPRTKMAFRVFQDPNDNWNYILKAKNLLTGVEAEERIPPTNESGVYRDIRAITQSGRPFDGRYLKVKEGGTTTVYKINVLSYTPANILGVEIGEIDGIPKVGDTIPISFTVQEVPDETVFIEFYIDDVYQDTIIITEDDGVRSNGVVYVTYEYQISEDWEAGTYEFQFYGENLVTRTVQVIEAPENDEIHLVNTSLYNQGDYGLYWEVTVEGNGTHHLLVKIDNGTEVTVYNGYITLNNEARTFAGTQAMGLVDGETYILKVYLDGVLAGTQEFTYREGQEFWETIEDDEEEGEEAGAGGTGRTEEESDAYQSAVNTFFGNPIWIILLLVISAGLGISAQTGVNPLTVIGGLVFFISMFGFISIGVGIGGLLIAVIPYVFNRGE